MPCNGLGKCGILNFASNHQKIISNKNKKLDHLLPNLFLLFKNSKIFSFPSLYFDKTQV
jgi:hypothetical protein